jgi:hypothetical protein
MRQKIADLINVIFGFRKFLLMLAIYLIAIIFRIQNLINGTEMVELLKSTTLAFMGANGVEHIVAAAKDYAASHSGGDDPKTPYEDLVSPSAQEADDLKAEEEAKKNG